MNLSPDQPKFRWIMLGLVSLVYLCFGLVSNAISPLVTPILNDLRMTYSQMGFILGVYPLIYIFASPFAGSMVDKWGIRKAILGGTLIIGISSLLRYFTSEWVGLLLAVALFGIGGPLISVGAPKLAAIWFQGKTRSTAVVIYMSLLSVGNILALSLTNSVLMPLTGYSWRLTFVYYGLGTLVAAGIWWFFARDVKVSATSSVSPGNVFRNLIKMRQVQLILVLGALNFAAGYALGSWLPNILEFSGLSPDIAGYASSIPILVGAVAIILIPVVIPPRFINLSLGILSLLTGVSAILIIGTSGALFLLGLILFGVSNFPIFPLLILKLMNDPEIGVKYMGSASGIFFSVSQIGGFTGPLIVGALVDMSGTFFAGALFVIAIMVISFWLCFLLKK